MEQNKYGAQLYCNGGQEVHIVIIFCVYQSYEQEQAICTYAIAPIA